MRRRNFRSPMLRLSSNRRRRLFEPTSLNNPKPKSFFKLPSGDLFLTLVLIVSYLLTRVTYENQSDSEIGKKIVYFVNEKTGTKFQIPSDLKMFKMNAHYKRDNKKISDVMFLSLLAFFSFKVNWNNMGSSTNIDKIAWSVSVLVVPIVINIFMEHKDKHKIETDSVSNVKQFKESNNQTKSFLSFALLLTLAVGVKLVHRTIVCKGGMTKPLLIQIIIIGTTVGLFLLAQKDIGHHNSVTSNDRINSQFKKEQNMYAEQFENKWPKKHKRVLEDWKEDENKYDNDEAAFVPTSKIIQLVRERTIKERFESIKKQVTSQSSFKTLFKLEGLVIDEKVKLKNVWPHIKVFYDSLKNRYKSYRIPIPEYLQTADLGDVIISISDNGKAFGLPKGGVTSGNTAYYKKLAYTIISEYLRLSPSSRVKDYDTLIDEMKDVIYTKILSQRYGYNLDENRRFGKQIFNHKLDGADFKKIYEDKLKNLYVSPWKVERYPTSSYSQIKNTSIIYRMLRYYVYDNKKLETFEDFIKYHKKKTKTNRYKYRNIKGNKPTLEDVKKNDYLEVNNRIFDRYYDYNEKDRYIQDHITATTHGAKTLPLGDEWVYKDYVSHYKSGKPRNDLNGNIVSSSNFEKSLANKSVNQHGWVIAFLLILSFTVCKKDTIDYIIEGSLWGYLIQNVARWDDISPDLM